MSFNIETSENPKRAMLRGVYVLASAFLIYFIFSQWYWLEWVGVQKLQVIASFIIISAFFIPVLGWIGVEGKKMIVDTILVFIVVSTAKWLFFLDPLEEMAGPKNLVFELIAIVCIMLIVMQSNIPDMLFESSRFEEDDYEEEFYDDDETYEEEFMIERNLSFFELLKKAFTVNDEEIEESKDSESDAKNVIDITEYFKNR